MNPETLQNESGYSNAKARLLSPKYRKAVWLGIGGTGLGCSAWLLTLAAMAGDWPVFALTLALVVGMVAWVGKACMHLGAKRFHWLALLLIVLTAHCLAMYWWKFDDWRTSSAITPENLLREKRIVTFTVVSMVAVVLIQLGIFYWLIARSQKNRVHVGGKR